MKTIFASIILTAAAFSFAGTADAAGCIKGAIVGGVAGHYAGHHPILGAAAGCAVGHHLAVMKHRRERAAMAQQRGY